MSQRNSRRSRNICSTDVVRAMAGPPTVRQMISWGFKLCLVNAPIHLGVTIQGEQMFAI